MRTTSSLLGTTALLMVLILSGCSPEAGSDPAPPPEMASSPGAPDPEAAITGLLAALAVRDFEEASRLTVDDQMLAIAVTGSVPTEALQSVLTNGGSDIGRNYWQSFADNLESFLGVAVGEVSVGRVAELEVDGVSFATVDLVVPGDSARRQLVVQRSDGWKVDVVASFGPALAQRLGRAAESFRADPSAAEILASLVRQRTSLQVSLDNSTLDPETAQVIRTALVSLGG